MALKGNLRDFSIVQILNLVNLAKKTGRLVIDGQGNHAQIVFREGKLAFAQIGQEDSSLAAVLLRSQKISQNQYKLLKEKAVQMSDKELGLLLINAGYISQPDILGNLQNYYLDIVRRFFAWVEGAFRFEPDISPPPDKIPIKIDLENLIIEGSRQLKEWEQLQEEIPSMDMSLKFIERPGADLRNLNLNVEEWRVVKFVNPKNTIRQIAQATKMNDLEIRRVVYALLQAGVIEIIRPAGSVGLPANLIPGANREEQKSLVNRLIDRIRAL